MTLPTRKVGSDSAGTFKRFKMVLKAGARELFTAIQDNPAQNLPGRRRSNLAEMPQDRRVGAVSENFDNCLNLLRMTGLDEARHASILPDWGNSHLVVNHSVSLKDHLWSRVISGTCP